MYCTRDVCTSSGSALGCTYSTRAVHIPCTVKTMRQLLHVHVHVHQCALYTQCCHLHVHCTRTCMCSVDCLQVEEVENVLSAQLLALEVIANFCYTESTCTHINFYMENHVCIYMYMYYTCTCTVHVHCSLHM